LTHQINIEDISSTLKKYFMLQKFTIFVSKLLQHAYSYSQLSLTLRANERINLFLELLSQEQHCCRNAPDVYSNSFRLFEIRAKVCTHASRMLLSHILNGAERIRAYEMRAQKTPQRKFADESKLSTRPEFWHQPRQLPSP